jgi:hypothetical protein
MKGNSRLWFLLLILVAVFLFGLMMQRSNLTSSLTRASTPEASKTADDPIAGMTSEQQVTVRRGFAKLMENNFLAKGMNVDVIADGPEERRLNLHWVLASKVVGYQMEHSADFQELVKQARDIGFQKVRIENDTDFWEQWNIETKAQRKP